MQFSYIAYLALLAHGTTTLAASLSIEDICSYTMPSGKEVGASICLRGDQPLKFAKEVSGTAKLGATGIQLCCQKGGICLLSDEQEPEVLCYDPVAKDASSHSNVRDCDLVNGKCGGKDGMFSMSTDGVQTVTSVVDGEGFTAAGGSSSKSGTGTGDSSSSSSAASPSGTEKASGAGTLVGSGGIGGVLMVVGFLAVVGGTLVL